MPVINRIAEFQPELAEWRRDIHTHPELGFEEHRTSALVAEKLKSFGIEVHRGIAGTGVVGTLVGGTGKGGQIALRADMDALPIQEVNTFGHRSRSDGKMHACGHDGHTTMLLGAARYLAETKNFDGVVHFVFQPAEEGKGGGEVMVREGLFDKFPAEEVYGMHNMPGLPVGQFATRPGPLLAARDNFEVTITGRGSHAAMPHQGIDPVVVGATAVLAIQSIVSRQTDAMKSLVVSVTQFLAGDAFNVIPQSVMLRGTCRVFDPALQASLEGTLKRIVDGVAATYGGNAELTYMTGYPATVNADRQTAFAAEVARDLAGADRVDTATPAVMGSEDFSYMLQARPGNFIFIGNGATASLHHPGYDFNDEALAHGASYWTRLVEKRLPR